MHIRKPRFPSELPEEEDPAPISLQEPTPNEVADYVSTKQEQLTTLVIRETMYKVTPVI